MSVLFHAERFMTLQFRHDQGPWPGRIPWPGGGGFLTLVSGVNIAVWFLLYRTLLTEPRAGSLGSRVRHRADAVSLCGLRFRLRIQVVPAARGRAADLPVRHVAVSVMVGRSVATVAEVCLRGAVGDDAAPARHDDGSGHHPDRRVGDRAAGPDRGMLLLACGADQELPRATPSKIRSGPSPSSRRDRPLPVAAGV